MGSFNTKSCAIQKIFAVQNEKNPLQDNLPNNFSYDFVIMRWGHRRYILGYSRMADL